MSSVLKVIAVGIAAGSMLPAFGAAFDDGVQQYSQGLYQQAAVTLTRAEGCDPRNYMVHYYLANALVYIKHHKEAIEEYRTCYALAPAGSVSEYCKEALNSYQQNLPDDSEIKQIRDTTYSAASSNESSKAPQIERSLAIIRRQLALEKQKHESFSEATASEAINSAQNAVKCVRENTEQQVSKLYAPHPRSSLAYTGDLQAREAQIRSQAKEEEDWILRQAQVKADHYRQVGEMQQSALDQVADNLEQQLGDDGTRSGIKLIPSGTNLYVRSYASVKPAKIYPEVHPAVARIYAEHSAGSSPASASATAGTLNTETTSVQRSVHGKLIDAHN